MSKQHNIWALNILHCLSHLSLCFFKVGQMQTVHPNSWWFVSRYVFLIGGDAISWQSRKQPPMVLSSIKSEYISIITTTKEALWLPQLLMDLSFSQDGPTCLHCDNQSCIKFTQNACFHDWMKHTELWFHFLQEKIDLQELELHFTSIETMWTDILTKSLPKPKHGLCF
jgi:hypothetical protein